jgi:hypothetical protein
MVYEKLGKLHNSRELQKDERERPSRTDTLLATRALKQSMAPGPLEGRISTVTAPDAIVDFRPMQGIEQPPKLGPVAPNPMRRKRPNEIVVDNPTAFPKV